MRNFILTAFLLLYSMSIIAQDSFCSSKGKWEAKILNNGVIESLRMKYGDNYINIPWHSSGFYAGPSIISEINHNGFRKISPFTYIQKDLDLIYTISYHEVNDNFTIRVNVKNVSNKIKQVNALSLRLGINHEMKDPSNYFNQFFPTLLRCEKSHFWGYFQNPNGQVLAIGSNNPIASWHLDYIGKGHRIGTSELDLLHKQPLPSRHPQNLFYLEVNEEKTWDITLLPVANIDEVCQAVSTACKVPAINIKQTTVSPGDLVDCELFFPNNLQKEVNIIDPNGKITELSVSPVKGNKYQYTFKAPTQTGLYQLITKSDNKQAYSYLYVRKPWIWYMEQARKEALRMEQKSAQHREAWMGFFSAYWAQVYSPDSMLLNETELKFKDFWDNMIDPKTGFYYETKNTWFSRPQNTSWMLGLLITRYIATKRIEDLELASKWADLLIEKFQLPNGAYKGYTALTMGAKFLQDLIWFEAPLGENDKKWKERYLRHKQSITLAGKYLLKEKDLGETEGESTYEDTQAGSAWSLLAMHALLSSSIKEKQEFLQESLDIQKRHECLTQALIPDARMRGGTLRWWEAQYDVLIHKNMMNSPHGWTMRSQFGAIYLYLLTGKEYFLQVAMNSIGSCIQSINHDSGELRWAFIADPYIEAKRFIQDYKTKEGKYIDEVIGEQWIPMISDWWRTNKNEVPTSTEKGWSCDNDVHEHFRFLAELYIPNAFVLEREDGTIRTWNCHIENKDNRVCITTDKNVSQVHFNLKSGHNVQINNKEYKINKGMNWIRLDNHYNIPFNYFIK